MPTIVDPTEFDKWSRDQITVDAELKIAALNAAERWVRNECRRDFTIAPASATARVFRPAHCTDVLWLDDCVSVTSVVENGTTLTVSTDYQLEPLNGISESGEAVPYDVIRRVNSWWYTDGNLATITVTARWGWAAIPYEVTEAVKYVAQAMLKGREITGGIVAVSEFGGVSERDAKVVRDMIHHYRGHKSWGIA